ncbi:UbiA family prenyltransferase [Nocardioides deserti]|uniref:UbiA family prenyltransferase n=1 Tax=Nocardioides deserti TaxID=1588644 RepID=UPI0019B4BD28|nr:UbiA family prenyltransferase [Nocardioides deserti]GGO76987.1 hypothetical protein GCM10012276_31040 [Nocardioides deserti]
MAVEDRATDTADEQTDEPQPAPGPEPQPEAPVVRGRRGLRDLEPVLLAQAAHPRQAVVTALGIAACAALAGRELREVGVVLLTVLVGQTILGWHNDLVDRRRDARHDLPGKPVAQERLDPGSVWFAIACGVLLLVPLAVSTGITAGSCYLLAVAIGLLGNVVLRKGLLSWVPWAASFALYPAYLSYGGWGGRYEGNPPEVAMVALFALLGIGVHVLRALWGLVPDNKDGWTYLPLRLGLRLGAARLLTLTSVYLGAVLLGLAFAGTSVGLSQ